MGCDIHVFAEIKIKGVKGWHLYDQPKFYRNYNIFGVIAGVRIPELITFNVKGLPNDLSTSVRFIYDQSDDYHTETYLSSTEVVNLLSDEKLFEDQPYNYLFGNSYGNFQEYPDEYPNDLEDFRWVIWFDN